MKKKIYKIIAVYMALNMLFEIIEPTVALALTTGPTQPEMQSFEPVGTTEMVDPFSGDFNYNIPLMTVPGPNGGYPINLAYHAGISMEQEASWVGLGWNINAGEINRQMRGLPDDFNGDVVTQEMDMQPNITASLTGKMNLEAVGYDGSIGFGVSTSLQLTWNSYKGIGIGIGQGMNANISGEGGSFSGSLHTDYNSLTGTTDLSASLSYSATGNADESGFGLEYKRNSLEGIKSLGFHGNLPLVNGLSFCGSSFIPHANMPESGFSIMASFDMGVDFFMINPYMGGEASFSINKISPNTLNLNSYGYLYSENRGGNSNSLMDFNREKDVNLTKDIPALPMPIFTHDIYFVNGQGIGGTFRPYRSDIGILKDPEITSDNAGVDAGMEIGIGNTIKAATDICVSYTKGYSGPWRDASTWTDLQPAGSGPGLVGFEGKNTNAPLYEPFYFKNAGDMTANFDEENSRCNLEGNATELPIKMVCGISASDFDHPSLSTIERPIVDVRVNSASLLSYDVFKNRQSRAQMMSMKTRGELSAGSEWSQNSIYDLGYFPRNSNPVCHAPSSYGYGSHSDHIGEISVINPDGNRYFYSIPAYNTAQKEVSFSVSAGDPIIGIGLGPNHLSSDGKIVDYTPGYEDSPGNTRNDDHFYTYKSLPPYAHSYLLTAIVSPDYVDITGDGPTPDDYGYYTKFNYTKLSSDYNWRSPYRKASFVPGFRSIQNDDKAGYVYGSKEMWYLNSIETKSHIAEFHISDRLDGRGAADPGNIIGFGMQVKKLDEIDLYCKSDPNYSCSGTPTPIKTVHFDYTYDLCGNVDNNDPTKTVGTNYYSGIDRNANVGKLTLKKVWFTFLGNQKGSLSPYEFDYHERTTGSGNPINLTENPNFSTFQFDRWGNYKSDVNYSSTNGYNTEDPYTIQRADFNGDGSVNQADADARNAQASVWCLKEITLPSGGKIKVCYESDDYAYVQDKQAMQMAKIVGIGQDGSGSEIGATHNDLTSDGLCVYFELKRQCYNTAHLLTSDSILPYVSGITDLYFKTYQDLKGYYTGGGEAYDYVNGYSKLGGSNGDGSFAIADGNSHGGTGFGVVADGSGKQYGYVKLAKINVHDNHYLVGLEYTNPIRKAGWQYLKLDRSDLLSPSSTNNLSSNPNTAALLQLVTGAISFLTSNVQLLTGYYKYCLMAGFCSYLKLDDPAMPSFIRVNTPDKIKYGGGYRVKSIEETDSWSGSGTTNNYGQEYSYRMPNGSSSGVAEYEPLIGGEEIPLHQPVRYNSEYFIVQHHDLYMELPYCESYFPGAHVGYSRIIVKGINHKDQSSNDVTKGTTGVTLYEYYTAKDFPVIVNTSGEPAHEKFRPKMNIPFVGNISFENHGFSQNFTVETNDMNGKLKHIATYPFSTDLNSGAAQYGAVSETQYIYNTDAPYSQNASNHLKNNVNVLFADAYPEQTDIGLTKEHFLDMKEQSSVSMINGGQFNMEVTFDFPPPIVFFNFSFVPKVNYSEMLNKTVVGMNVISRNGILIETKHSNEGSTVITDNLMFDAENGEPLLTTVTNNFDAPVYTYDYAAHWAYDGMGSAYKNMGATFAITQTGTICYINISGSPTTDPTNYLSLGDEVTITGSSGSYWVTNINSTDFTLQDKNGSLYSSGLGNMTIIRSGRRNLQDVSNGKIVSLSNPISSRTFPLFVKWNDYVVAHGTMPLGTSYTFVDCATGSSHTASPSLIGGNTLRFSISDGLCGTESFIDFVFSQPLNTTGYAYHLTKAGNKVFATYGGTSIQGISGPGEGCLKECMPDVLHADATEFKDNWSSEIDTVQLDVYKNQNIATVTPLSNPYASGYSGIWRTMKKDLYQVDRLRSGGLNTAYSTQTNIAKDGTYNNFVLFDWTQYVSNPQWTMASHVSKINPYGYEVENNDALGIFSSAIYGYNNSLQTAISKNARYYEIGYDGFEDYGSTYNSHGHINLTGTVSISSDFAHTGKKSLVLGDNQYAGFTSETTLVATPSTSVNYFVPMKSKTYLVSCWYKSHGSPLTIGIAGASATSATYSPLIGGWTKVERTFTSTSGPAPVAIVFMGGSNAGTEITYLDDIRIQPFNSNLKTYVYDPDKLWLMAELDDENFATFYNYDKEGTMFQVKKETTAGISTIKTTRSNLAHR